jgi:hypothetical protein
MERRRPHPFCVPLPQPPALATPRRRRMDAAQLIERAERKQAQLQARPRTKSPAQADFGNAFCSVLSAWGRSSIGVRCLAPRMSNLCRLAPWLFPCQLTSRKPDTGLCLGDRSSCPNPRTSPPTVLCGSANCGDSACYTSPSRVSCLKSHFRAGLPSRMSEWAAFRPPTRTECLNVGTPLTASVGRSRALQRHREGARGMSDNQRLTCPKCGGTLVYLGQHGQLQTYRCPIDGPLVYPPDGRLRHETLEETEARIRRR